MALNATLHNLTVELADVDRNVYVGLELRMAKEPSESADYFLMRLLAYCLEYAEGISFTQGVAAGDEPAVWVHDLTGRMLAWIDVGLPDAPHLHRGSRTAERVAVYTHRDATQLLGQLSGKKIHRAGEIAIYSLDPRFVSALAGRIERRAKLSVTRSDGELFVEVAGENFRCPVVTHRLDNSPF
ncbi:MAG: YaeQ family protein [Caldilineaceae bacterium]|nr:YaeQ family protein [Caldilineaceae bacterium]